MKRRLFIAAIFLLAGAVVNVAVAWGLAVSVNPLLAEREDSTTDNGIVCRWNRAGVALTTIYRGPSDAAWPWPVVASAGWPLICSWCEYEFLYGGGVGPIEGGLELGLELWPGPSPLPKALPLRPIWPGFAVNTLFYATFLWLLIPGPFVLRRFIRVKRGLCPACGYPRGQSDVCSECGEAIPSRKVTT